jgi:hypothetical protein
MMMGIFLHSGFGIWLLDFFVADVASPWTERLKDPNYVQGLHKLFGMNQPSLPEPRKSFVETHLNIGIPSILITFQMIPSDYFKNGMNTIICCIDN